MRRCGGGAARRHRNIYRNLIQPGQEQKNCFQARETGRREGEGVVRRGGVGWGGPERRAIDREQLRRSRAPAILNPLRLVRYSSRLVPPGTPTFPFPHPPFSFS